MNKKGELLSEQTVKILMAVIGIGILIIFSVKIYGMFKQDSSVEQAKASLELLSSSLDKVEKGESALEEVMIESPDNWWIIAWPYKDNTEKPEQCKQNCICICDIPKIVSQANSLDNCNSNGVCKDVSMKIKTLYKSPLDEWYANLLKNVVGWFNDVENVPLDIRNVISIKIYSQNGEIIIER